MLTTRPPKPSRSTGKKQRKVSSCQFEKSCTLSTKWLLFKIFFFSWRDSPLVGLSLLLIHEDFCGFYITHNDTPQSVGLLWMSDQLVAETSTCTTHNTQNRQTSRPPGGIRTRNANKRAEQKLALGHAATGIGKWRNLGAQNIARKVQFVANLIYCIRTYLKRRNNTGVFSGDVVGKERKWYTFPNFQLILYN